MNFVNYEGINKWEGVEKPTFPKEFNKTIFCVKPYTVQFCTLSPTYLDNQGFSNLETLIHLYLHSYDLSRTFC
jgi:hypothetical protein